MLLRAELRMLLRAPWRTALLCVLLAAAVGAASLGGGLLAASRRGMAELAEKYTTVAVLKNTEDKEIDAVKASDLRFLADEVSCARTDRRRIYGGYSPGIHTATSLKETWEQEINKNAANLPREEALVRGYMEMSRFDGEYDCFAAVVTCIDKYFGNGAEGEDWNEDGVTFQVDQIISVHESYSVPKTVIMRCIQLSDGHQKTFFEEGKQYLISLGRIIYSRFPTDPVQIWVNTDNQATESGSAPQHHVVTLDGSLDEALTGENGEWLKSRIRDCEISNRSVTVIGTERLNGILLFNQGDLYITQGRDFTAQEYAQNVPVCIMSEKLAQMNNISIGSTLDVQLYQTYWSGVSDEPVWQRETFDGTLHTLEAPREYTVVGLFNTPAWDFKNETTTLSPNTIIIPSPETEIQRYVSGHLLINTGILIDNGHAEEFLAEMEELEPGSSEYFVIYDQGYSEVAPTIEAFTKNARYVAMGCAAVFMLAAGVFLAFAAAKNRHDLGVMRSLGATKVRTEGAFLLRCGMPAVAGGVLGALAGQVLFGRAVAVLGAEELISRPAGTLWVIAAGCTAAVICLTALAGAVLVNKKPQALMREKE